MITNFFLLNTHFIPVIFYLDAMSISNTLKEMTAGAFEISAATSDFLQAFAVPTLFVDSDEHYARICDVCRQFLE